MDHQDNSHQNDQEEMGEDGLNNEFPPVPGLSPRSDPDSLSSSGGADLLNKKPRLEQEVTPPPSPGRSATTGSPKLMVPASPPKFVNFDQLMQAATGVSNMMLAHEIAVDADFKLENNQPPENSLEKRVKEVMHKAFWDVLNEKLHEDPPDLSQAMVLLGEVKAVLLDILLPHHQKFRSTINEVMDIDLIKQKADHGALDIMYYADFVVSIMAQLCAPARDERVAAIKQYTDVVPLFKEIFAVIDLMKMDMANFTIQQIRPYIQQQSVEYEKLKFQEFLKVQADQNLDGLLHTKTWLTRVALRLEEGVEGAAARPSPARIMNTAYLELLDWKEEHEFPETLLMDESRFVVLKEQMKQLCLISSILLITYNTVGASIAGIQELKQTLKCNMATILANIPNKNVQSVMPNVVEQVNKDVKESLVQHGFACPDDTKQNLLKQQVQAVSDPNHAVHKLVVKRVFGFVDQLISSAKVGNEQIPPGLSSVSEELSRLCGQFIRLVSHNRNVFGAHYADIISSILRRHDEVD